MKSQRLLLTLTLLNAVLLVALLADRTRVLYAAQSELPVLRGRSLEIVDDDGRLRASIRWHGPTMANGKRYGGAVVLVMGSGGPNAAPGVKLGASDSGAGLGLSNGTRVANGRSSGIEMHADDTRLILTDKQGHEKTLRPQDP